ncbi:MAG: DUF3846 domain-containing protein [Oscillospiraceae bacterium]|nr:DUF3846 domain-containing protein [Oscillospiraceae bacterium]
MKEKFIEVIKVSPQKPAEIVKIENTLEGLQKAVSVEAPYVGLIEIIYLENKVCLLGNEEAKLICLPPNRRLGKDIICGTFYITSEDKEGNLASLNEKQKEKYLKRFAEPEFIDPEELDKIPLFEFFGF